MFWGKFSSLTLKLHSQQSNLLQTNHCKYYTRLSHDDHDLLIPVHSFYRYLLNIVKSVSQWALKAAELNVCAQTHALP